MENTLEDFETDSGKKISESCCKEKQAVSINNTLAESFFWGGVANKHGGFLIDKRVDESQHARGLEEKKVSLTEAPKESGLNCFKLKKEGII